MTDKIFINWADFHQDVKDLASLIKQQKRKISQIVAVSRGGLIPAGILAYELDIRNCETINMSTYDGMEKKDDKDIKIDYHLTKAGAETLIVDDLSDSGRTYKILRQIYPQAFYATVYAKPTGAKEVDIYAKPIPDKWIVFPWD